MNGGFSLSEKSSIKLWGYLTWLSIILRNLPLSFGKIILTLTF